MDLVCLLESVLCMTMVSGIVIVDRSRMFMIIPNCKLYSQFNTILPTNKERLLDRQNTLWGRLARAATRLTKVLPKASPFLTKA